MSDSISQSELSKDDQEEGKEQGGAQAVQHGVQAAGVASRGQGPDSSGGAGLWPAVYMTGQGIQQQGQNAEAQRLLQSEAQPLLQSEAARLKREVARLEEESAVLKKGGGVLHEAAGVKCATMRTQEDEFAVRLMCRVLRVSLSGYFAWHSRTPSKQAQATAARPNQVWVGEITYLGIRRRLAVSIRVMDLFSRKVISWSMSERMTATLVRDAPRMVLFRRKWGVIMHTDCGGQYCSRERRALVDAHGLITDMSAKGNCYENAAMESCNHSLKVETIHGERFGTRDDAREHVFEYIEVDYNQGRLHSTLGYLSPEQFERGHAV